MLTKCQAIVISTLKYGDSDLIAKCFTLERGTVSYLLRGVLKSTKGKLKAAYFQPLTQLYIEEYYKPKSSLQSIKEVKLACHYTSIHVNVMKSSIALFLSEVLTSVLKEESPQEDLFSYLSTSLQVLDYEEKVANFHLLFLVQLSKYLGVFPHPPKGTQAYFNLNEARFEAIPSDLTSIEGRNVTVLMQLMAMDFNSLSELKLNATERQSFLNMFLTYLEIHIIGFKKPRSLEVLNKLFA